MEAGGAHAWRWHKFSFAGQCYLVDGATGAVHWLDEVASAAWDLASGSAAVSCHPPAALQARFGPAVAQEAWHEVRALLTRRPRSAGSFHSAFAACGAELRIGAPLKALCLLVAMDCNLSCSYCFAAPEWQHRGARHMPVEVARQAIDLLVAASGGARTLQIDYFGGEPTLNWEVVREATGYATLQASRRNKSVHFTLTTNALRWTDELSALVNAYRFQVIFSLDGRPAVHDRMRRARGGRPTHQTVLDNVRRAVASLKWPDYWIRGTFTRFNLDFAEDVRYLVGEGFRHISLEPVVALPEAPWALQAEDLPAVEAEYEKLAEFYRACAKAGRPFEFFHFRLAPPSGPCLARRISGCGAGYQYLAVTPEGDLYPCHQFVGREAYRIGSIGDPGVVAALAAGAGRQRRSYIRLARSESFQRAYALTERFRRAHALSKPACRSCWARLYCGGGCHANSELLEGDILGAPALYCRLQKKRIELSIALRAELAGSGDGVAAEQAAPQVGLPPPVAHPCAAGTHRHASRWGPPPQ